VSAVPEELRQAFHRDMKRIDDEVAHLFALVSEAAAGATDALLSGDRDSAELLVARDELIDRVFREVDALVERQLTLQAPVASDLRFLLTLVRIVPEIERSGDLAEHIAMRAVGGIPGQLTARMRGLIARMGALCVEMWRATADAYMERDGSRASWLAMRDDELDTLHDEFTAEAAVADVPAWVAMELALVGRFYERLGDHAVHVAERVRYLAGPG
jgi:phosphate transport system protein